MFNLRMRKPSKGERLVQYALVSLARSWRSKLDADEGQMFGRRMRETREGPWMVFSTLRAVLEMGAYSQNKDARRSYVACETYVDSGSGHRMLQRYLAQAE